MSFKEMLLSNITRKLNLKAKEEQKLRIYFNESLEKNFKKDEKLKIRENLYIFFRNAKGRVMVTTSEVDR